MHEAMAIMPLLQHPHQRNSNMITYFNERKSNKHRISNVIKLMI